MSVPTAMVFLSSPTVLLYRWMRGSKRRKAKKEELRTSEYRRESRSLSRCLSNARDHCMVIHKYARRLDPRRATITQRHEKSARTADQSRGRGRGRSRTYTTRFSIELQVASCKALEIRAHCVRNHHFFLATDSFFGELLRCHFRRVLPTVPANTIALSCCRANANVNFTNNANERHDASRLRWKMQRRKFSSPIFDLADLSGAESSRDV